MQFSQNNFFLALRNVILGGGKNSAGEAFNDAGILVEGSTLGPSGSAAGETDIGTFTFMVPRDYDERTDDLSLRVAGRMDGATDSPALSITVTRVRAGEADSILANAVSVLTLDDTFSLDDLSLSENELRRDDSLQIAVSAAAHTTDAIEALSVVPVYRSTIVSFDETNSAGEFLR